MKAGIRDEQEKNKIIHPDKNPLKQVPEIRKYKSPEIKNTDSQTVLKAT